MTYKSNLRRLKLGITLLALVIALYILIINQSILTLTSNSGFQNYEVGKIYFLGCRIIPSHFIPAKITKIELKNANGNSINSNSELFNSKYYWDSNTNIGAITAVSDELETLNLLPLNSEPIIDRDGNYALVIAITPIKDFDTEIYKEFYYEIEYKVLGFPRNLKFKPFNLNN